MIAIPEPRLRRGPFLVVSYVTMTTLSKALARSEWPTIEHRNRELVVANDAVA
jgi:hypothetical protein